MPTCPMCEHAVDYDDLKSHLRFCDMSEEKEYQAIKDLEDRLLDIEHQLDNTLEEIDTKRKKRKETAQ